MGSCLLVWWSLVAAPRVRSFTLGEQLGFFAAKFEFGCAKSQVYFVSDFLKDKEKINKNVFSSLFDTPIMNVPFAKFNHNISLSLTYINDLHHLIFQLYIIKSISVAVANVK